MLQSKTQTTETPLNETGCLLPLAFLRKSGSAVPETVRRLPTGLARLIRALPRWTVNKLRRGFFPEKSEAFPDSRAASIYYSLQTVNPRIASLWPQAARPAARIKSKQTPLKKRRGGRFENLVARYYRGVCTFASRLTNDPVEAVLLTHAAFTSTRHLLRIGDEVRLVTILLTAVMRAAQLAKSGGVILATRVHANNSLPEPQNPAERRRCSPRCPICLKPG